MTLFKTAGSLALVLAVIFALAWLFKRFIQPLQNRSSMEGVKILSSQDIGPKRKLMVLEFGNRRILVGMSENHMTALCETETTSFVREWDPQKTSPELQADQVTHA